MIIENINDIYHWNIEQLWNAINTIEEQKLEKDKITIHKIKHGFNIKIPIQWINKGWYQENPNGKRVSVLGYAKYELLPFLEEIETREKEIRKILLENLDDDETTEPRGINDG